MVYLPSPWHNCDQQFCRAWSKDQFLQGVGAEEAARCDCTALQQALHLVGRGAQRMIVGHTIQAAGINEACGQRVFRIDVGLSHGCGNGAPQVGRWCGVGGMPPVRVQAWGRAWWHAGAAWSEWQGCSGA